MIDGVIFDKDGTLFDFRRSWGGWAASLLREIAQDEAHARRMGSAIGYDLGTGQFASDSPVIACTVVEIAEFLLPHLPGRGAVELVGQMNALAAVAPMVEVVPLVPFVQALRGRGLRLGLATNDTEVPARAHLAASGIEDMFDYIAGCDSGHGAKPGPGMLLAFAQAQGLSPGRVAMVGDSRHDLIAGRNAGMRTVAVLTGIAEASELAPLADVVLPDISALEDWIDRLGAAES